MKTRLFPACAILLALHGCGDARPRPRPVAEPSDLAQLDRPVRQRYEELRRRLDVLRSRPEASSDELAEAFGQLGNWCLLYRYHGAAAAAYRNAIDLDPSSEKWLYYLGMALTRLGDDPEPAVAAFTAFLERRGDDVPALVRLADLELRRGRLEAAEAFLEQAVAADGESSRALADLGHLALQGDEPGRAIELYERALAADPKATSVRYNLGLALRRLGHEERAAALLAEVGEKDPGKLLRPRLDDPLAAALEEERGGARVHMTRGRKALESGRYRIAVQEFERALVADPGRHQARLHLAIALRRTGQEGRALGELLRVLEEDPENTLAHRQLALALAATGRRDQAVAHLETALAIDAGDAETRRHLALQLLAGGRPQEALPHLERTLELQPALTELRSRHAFVLVELGRFADAASAVEEHLGVAPGTRALELLRARLLAAAPPPGLRDGARALVLAESAFAADASASHAETVAMAWAELGDFERAAAWQRAVLEATERAGRRDLLEPLRRRLAAYDDGRAWREPWGRGETYRATPVIRP